VTENLEQLYNDALSAHGQGQLPRAEQLYRQVLAADPSYRDTAHWLGVLATQRGAFDVAEPLFRQAEKIDPQSPMVRFNLGVALQAMGRFSEAIAAFDAAIVLKPDYLEAHYNRAVVLQEMKRFEDAIAGYDSVLLLNPYSVEALSNRGAALHAMGRLEEALSAYDKALAVQPGFLQTLHNRGLALHDMQRFEEALASFDRALTLQPNHVEALIDRGKALHELRRYDEALGCFARALAARPGHPYALYGRGMTLRVIGRFDEALSSYDRAIASFPSWPHAHYGRGVLLFDMGRWGEALASYSNALKAQPGFVYALQARSSLLMLAGEYEAAAADLRALLAAAPNSPYAEGNLLHCRMSICDWDGFDGALASLTEGVHARRSVCQPFYFFVASPSPADQLECAQAYVDDIYPAAVDTVWKGEVYSHDKIRVAYLSADFHEHATAALTAELFERHDRSKFEITGVSFGPDAPSEMRARLVSAFDDFIDVRAKGDRDIAEALRAKEIDVAVDLKGFGTGSRAGIFAQRFAPVQVNYLVNPGTMGASYIDYILADGVLIPPGFEGHFSEKVVRLPDSYQINDSKRPIADLTPSRGELGLPDEGFVFCCFNNNYKLTPAMFDVWMRLLKQVDGCVLWLLEGNGAVKRNLVREAEARGVTPERLVFARRTALPEHLARHRAADLFLDTLPCNAHTTASDALWAGLPVLTIRGETFAGRVAASLLAASGLPAMVTDSLEAYEAKALSLARSPSALTALKQKLADNRLKCALFDTDRTRRHIEAAYEEMTARARRGEAPRSFDIPAIG
jgi:predicted O-linked N-acetylglucosamine transferase (SPINDLY family)